MQASTSSVKNPSVRIRQRQPKSNASREGPEFSALLDSTIVGDPWCSTRGNCSKGEDLDASLISARVFWQVMLPILKRRSPGDSSMNFPGQEFPETCSRTSST